MTMLCAAGVFAYELWQSKCHLGAGSMWNPHSDEQEALLSLGLELTREESMELGATLPRVGAFATHEAYALQTVLQQHDFADASLPVISKDGLAVAAWEPLDLHTGQARRITVNGGGGQKFAGMQISADSAIALSTPRFGVVHRFYCDANLEISVVPHPEPENWLALLRAGVDLLRGPVKQDESARAEVVLPAISFAKETTSDSPLVGLGANSPRFYQGLREMVIRTARDKIRFVLRGSGRKAGNFKGESRFLSEGFLLTVKHSNVRPPLLVAHISPTADWIPATTGN